MRACALSARAGGELPAPGAAAGVAVPVAVGPVAVVPVAVVPVAVVPAGR